MNLERNTDISFIFKQTWTALSSLPEKCACSEHRYVHLQGGKTCFTFKDNSHPLSLLLLLSRSCSVWKQSEATHCEKRRQVTVIYPEISHVFVSDEFMWKLRVKASDDRLAIEHNQDMGAFEEWHIRMTENNMRICSLLCVLKDKVIWRERSVIPLFSFCLSVIRVKVNSHQVSCITLLLWL